MTEQYPVHINLWVSRKLYLAVKREALAQGTTISHIGRVALQHYVNGEAGWNRRPK